MAITKRYPVRRRRVVRRRGYGSRKYRSNNRRGRQMAVMKSLIPHTAHYFKRMGVQIPVAVLWDSTNAVPYINNVGILTTEGGSNYLNGWRVTNGINSTFFASNGSNGAPTVAKPNLLTGSTGLPNTYQFGLSGFFSLQSVQQYTDFTSLFDQYKIVGIKLSIRFHHNVATYGSPATIPTLYHYVDYDDFTIPSSKNSMLQHEGSRQTLLIGGRTSVIKWKPTTLQSVLTDGIASAPVIRKGGYNNATDSQVNYMGVKLWLDNVFMTAGTQLLLDIQPEFILAFKDTL